MQIVPPLMIDGMDRLRVVDYGQDYVEDYYLNKDEVFEYFGCSC